MPFSPSVEGLKGNLETILGYITNVDYNALGQITGIDFNNGVSTTYTYDANTFRLTRIYSLDDASAIMQDLNYTYDSGGKIVEITDNVNTDDQVFTYDALDRLLTATGEEYGPKAYAYDNIGNLTLKGGLTFTYGEGSAGPHAVTSLSSGTTYSYDANGNMIERVKGGVTRDFTYDSENRLTSVEDDSDLLVAYTYDGDGGRTIEVNHTGASPATHHYVGSLYENAVTDSRISRFIFLGGKRIASLNNTDKFYYHENHLGSINIVSDVNADEEELIQYAPYGEIVRHEKYGTGEEVAWHYFTGQKLEDTTGLYYYNSRYYDHEIGRFISADTFVPEPGNPQSLNRYSYCYNNPVNIIDPTGHTGIGIGQDISDPVGMGHGEPGSPYDSHDGSEPVDVMQELGIEETEPYEPLTYAQQEATKNAKYYEEQFVRSADLILDSLIAIGCMDDVALNITTTTLIEILNISKVKMGSLTTAFTKYVSVTKVNTTSISIFAGLGNIFGVAALGGSAIEAISGYMQNSSGKVALGIYHGGLSIAGLMGHKYVPLIGAVAEIGVREAIHQVNNLNTTPYTNVEIRNNIQRNYNYYNQPFNLQNALGH